MIRRIPSLLIAVLIFAVALSAQETVTPPPGGQGGNLFVGTRGLDNSNYLGKISEYDTARQGLRPSLGASYWVQRGGYFFDTAGEYRGDAKDQKYFLDFQANRYFRIRSYFTQFLHRLDHDPLKDLDAGKGGPMVWHEDFVPGVNFQPSFNEVKTELELTVPGATWLKFRAGHWSFQRHGDVQARSISKCSSCHVQSQLKRIDQRQHELSGGVSLRFHKASIDYDYVNRQSNERGEAPTMTFDTSIHPVTLLPVFGNRVIYDNRDGELPYAMVPDNRKSRHQVRARAELPGDARLSAAFTKSNLRNKFTGLGVDSWGWNGKLTVPVGKRLQFMAQARQIDIEGDSVFVELQEPVALGGPQAGKTYVEAYPSAGPISFLRDSVRNRNRLSMKGELSASLAKYTTLRGGYEFIRLDRDHYDIGRTDTNRFYVSLNGRRKETGSGDWSYRLRYRYDNNQDPFLHHKAAVMPAVQPTPTPGASAFAGTQYYILYASRQADLSSFPTAAHMVEPSVSWTPMPRMSATLHYRYRTLRNDDLNFSDWSRASHMPGAEFWFSPLERLDFTAAYTFHNERSETLFGIPVYDG